MAGEARQLGEQLVRLRVVEVRQRRLAERGRMQRQHRPDLEDLQARIRTEDVVDDEQAVAVRHADPHRLLHALGEDLRPRERSRPQLAQVEVAVRELQQLGAELVLVAVGVLLDETVVLERLQQSVDGGLRETDVTRQLAHTQAPRSTGQRLQDPSSSIDRLNHYCRMLFDIVEWQS